MYHNNDVKFGEGISPIPKVVWAGSSLSCPHPQPQAYCSLAMLTYMFVYYFTNYNDGSK